MTDISLSGQGTGVHDPWIGSSTLVLTCSGLSAAHWPATAYFALLESLSILSFSYMSQLSWEHFVITGTIITLRLGVVLFIDRQAYRWNYGQTINAQDMLLSEVTKLKLRIRNLLFNEFNMAHGLPRSSIAQLHPSLRKLTMSIFRCTIYAINKISDA